MQDAEVSRRNTPAAVLFFGGLSLAAVGGALAAVSILGYEEKLEDGTLRTQSDNERLLQAGRGFGLASDIAVGTGLASAAVGALLWGLGIGEGAQPAVACAPLSDGAVAKVGLSF